MKNQPWVVLVGVQNNISRASLESRLFSYELIQMDEIIINQTEFIRANWGPTGLNYQDKKTTRQYYFTMGEVAKS
jgi:hypothetical protein